MLKFVPLTCSQKVEAHNSRHASMCMSLCASTHIMELGVHDGALTMYFMRGLGRGPRSAPRTPEGLAAYQPVHASLG